jgi:hypothetical protein
LVYPNGSNGLWQAEDAVFMLPGFTAWSGSEFIARVEDCNETPEKLSSYSIEPEVAIDDDLNRNSISGLRKWKRGDRDTLVEVIR